MPAIKRGFIPAILKTSMQAIKRDNILFIVYPSLDLLKGYHSGNNIAQYTSS